MNTNTDKSLIQENNYCLFNSNALSRFTPDMLSPKYWLDNKAVTGSAQGRGTTWFVRYSEKQNANGQNNDKQEQHWVLRHYYRGGLIGKFNKDSYIFTGIENTRAAREFALLSHMQTLQLPAPKPIAYRVIRKGLVYQADLLSTRIQNAKDLVAILTQHDLSDGLWHKIGATIRRFHAQGIYHHDLNAHNILVDDKEQVFLIDFDRGELRAQSKKKQLTWQESNMARLQRSFIKELNQLPEFYFNDKNWQELMSGYQEENQQ